MLGLLDMFLVTVFDQESMNKTPEFILFLGRFHPLILHLPIGGLLLVFYFEVVGRFRKKYSDTLIRNGLGFSAVFAILACVLGYFLSLEGGYEEKITNIHMYTGIGTAILITILFWLKKSSKDKLYFPLFVLTIILISVTGHYGSVLTHGDSFLTQYSPLATKKEKPKVIDSLQYFSDVIYPILEDKCIQCHNATKQKGGLSLISEAVILQGGDEGKGLLPGNAFESNLVKRIVLPLEDENHMPPAGKNQITSNELWLLKHWINNGASFSDKALAFEDSDTLVNLLGNYLEKDIELTPEASVSAINEVVQAGFSLHRIATDQPHLSAKFDKDSISKEAISALKGIARQLVSLDLNATHLTDDMTKGLKKLKRLEHLRLDNNQISNKTLEYLVDLERIKVLNLHHTLVDNEGLSMIVDHISPEDIYVWNTKVDEQYVKEKIENDQIVIHHGIFEGFAEIKPLKPPTLITKQTIFKDSLEIEFDQPLRNARLYYTLDGTEPDSTSSRYTAPIKIANSVSLKAKMYQKEWLPSPTMKEEFFKIKHKIKDFNMQHKPSVKYPGSYKVFDFVEASTLFSDGKWAGFEGEDLITNISFEESQAVNSISISSLQDTGSWIFFPKKIEIYAKNNNASFQKIETLSYDATDEKQATEVKKKRFKLEFPAIETKQIKIVVHNVGKLPNWHQGAGQKGWLFVDEILIQ